MASIVHHQSTHDRISAWLRGLDSPAPTAAPLLGIKRRRPLGDMDGNTHQHTLAKRVVVEKVTGDNTSPTPRPRRVAPDGLPSTPTSIPAFHLPPPPPASEEPPIWDTSSASLASDSTAASSRKRKRSESPTKQMMALRRAAYGMKDRQFGAWLELPLPLQPLAKRMMEIQRGVGIVSTNALDLAALAADGIDDSRLVAADAHGLHGSPSVEFVREITELSNRNSTDLVCEAMWNCSVHAPLLQRAWRLSRHKEKLRWDNISTAAIEPAELRPTLATSESLLSKKADFSISFVLDEETEEALQSQIDTVSHTYYAPVCYRPIAMSIETKLPGEKWSEAVVQLSTWALAHIYKLRQLLRMTDNADAVIPPLPLAIVQGDTWHFVFVEVGLNSATLWQSILLASTSTPRGTCQVMAALQYWMRWTHESYRPWFEANIVDRLLKRATRRSKSSEIEIGEDIDP